MAGGGKPTTPINSKGHKNGGYRPGGGRPKGSMNQVAAAVREVASLYTEAAIHKAAEMAGLMKVPALNKAGQPIMEKAIDDNGKQLLDPKTREPLLRQKLKFNPANSEQARIAALQILIERGAGKAVQPMANDPDNPLIAPVGKLEMEIVPVGAPSNDDEPLPEADEEAEPQKKQA